MTDTPPESTTDVPVTADPTTADPEPADPAPAKPMTAAPPAPDDATQDDPDAPGLAVLTGSMADPLDAAEPNEPA